MTHNATSATLELDAVNMSPPATSISGSKGVDETSVSNSSKYTYRDFANAVAAPSEENFNPLPASRNNFPVQLHVLLSHAEGEGLLSIVSWKPHGRCFVIHRLHDFEQLVLPRFFRQTKYASFQRQLNIYGFQRLSTGPDKGDYYHELFLRGKPFLANRILRMSIKGQGPRQAYTRLTEPNFYCLPSIPSSPAVVPTILPQAAEQKAGASSLGLANHQSQVESLVQHHQQMRQLQQNQQQQAIALGGSIVPQLNPLQHSQPFHSSLPFAMGVLQTQQAQALGNNDYVASLLRANALGFNDGLGGPAAMGQPIGRWPNWSSLLAPPMAAAAAASANSLQLPTSLSSSSSAARHALKTQMGISSGNNNPIATNELIRQLLQRQQHQRQEYPFR